MVFSALDVVLGLTMGAIDILVKMFAAMADQTGHDKARAMTQRSLLFEVSGLVAISRLYSFDRIDLSWVWNLFSE